MSKLESVRDTLRKFTYRRALNTQVEPRREEVVAFAMLTNFLASSPEEMTAEDSRLLVSTREILAAERAKTNSENSTQG